MLFLSTQAFEVEEVPVSRQWILQYITSRTHLLRTYILLPQFLQVTVTNCIYLSSSCRFAMVDTPYGLVVIVVGAMIATLRILWKCIHHFATDLVDTCLTVVYKNIYTRMYTNSYYYEEGRGMLHSNAEK